MKTTESVKTVETPEEYRLWLEATTDMTAEQIKFSVDAYEKEYFSKKHETNLADEYDKHVEQMQVNGGLSEVAIEAEINAHEKEENVELEEQEEIVTVFNDTNGNPHYVQEIVSILENFYKLEEQRWNIPEEQKTIVSHLLEIAEIEKADFEKSIVKLREYMDTKEFEQEERNYAEIFTPILMTSLGQDFDEETHTFSSEKFSYKFSTDELLQKTDISTFDKELIDYKMDDSINYEIINEEDKDIMEKKEQNFDEYEKYIAPKNNALVKDLSKVIIFDTETTGLTVGEDEILQVSIIDGYGNKLFDKLLKPEHKKEWKKAMMINHISPKLVEHSPSIKEVIPEIQSIIDNADILISYNGRFDVNFLEAAGVRIEDKSHLDIIKPSASITKFPAKNENDKRAIDGYHYPKLAEVSDKIGVKYEAHNSLEDSKATLAIAQYIYGQKLENLTQEELIKYTIDEKKFNTSKKQIIEMTEENYHKNIGKFTFEKHPELIEEIKDKGDEPAKSLLTRLDKYPDGKNFKTILNTLIGEYMELKHPEVLEEYNLNIDANIIIKDKNISSFNIEIISPTDILTQKINGSDVSVHLSMEKDNSVKTENEIKMESLPTKPWNENIKEVVTNSSYEIMIENRELQIEAKKGNEEAAVELVEKLVNKEVVSNLAKKYPNAIVVPVPSIETADKKPNAIPLNYALEFEDLGLDVLKENEIIEIDSVHHTGKKSFKRAVNRPHFAGVVQEGKEYIIVDDVFTMGGTINSLRSYIENKGGNVVAVSTLTAGVENSKIIAITDDTLNELVNSDNKGELLNAIRKLDIAENFEALTEPIGRYISRNREKILNEERTRRTQTHSKRNDEQTQTIEKEQRLNQSINQNNNLNAKKTLTPTEYLAEKINASGINIHLSKEEMKAILEAGKDVQKLAVKYGTNQNIESENKNSFNGYGTYVVSVNEENARQLGIKIASRKYGGTFYINNQPLSQFLQEKNFSSYWIKRLEQLNTNSVDNLSHEIIMANVNGNATLEQEQNKLSTILSLDLIEYKREQTYLYSVEIPDNDNTNYLLYNNPIGIDQATKINNELQKMGVEWRVSRSDIGKNIYFELLSKNVFDGNQKAASEFLKENVGFVGMQMDNANYIIFNDKDMSINNKVQYMKSENGEVYGFTFDGEIYIDEDLVNSNVLAHEYTHIWDNYVQRNNPELWQKGMTCLKGTSLWYEITEDKNYENLRTDDEILSECHARIVGKMAEQVLERIAARDGELTKDKIIDWDKEVNEYVTTELLIKPELGDENYISESVKAEYLKEFLSMPMKDLMNEVKVQMGKGKNVENEAIHLKSNIVEDMSEDIKDIYSKKEQFIKLNLSPASDWLIKKEKEVGIDISGYMHQITTDFMKHTLNNHGDEKSEEQRGNIAITEDDFTNIQSVFEKPDLVVFGLRRKNEDMIIYTKKLEDGTTVYMEEVLSSKKNQALRSKTMYKSKNEISIEKLEKILRENKQNDCSKMIITLGEVAISSVSYSEPNSVGSQIQHPTGDSISLHQNNDIVNKNDIRKKLSVEGGRSSINHLDDQDSAASISARTDTSNVQHNGDEVNSLSESNTTAKIQKYAKTIDNSQTEIPKEFVEKSSKDIDIQKEETFVPEKKELSQKENKGIVPRIVQDLAIKNFGYEISKSAYKGFLSKMAESFFEIENKDKWNCSEDEKSFLLKLKEYKENKDIKKLNKKNISEFLNTEIYANNKSVIGNLYNLIYSQKEDQTKEFSFKKEFSEKEEKFDIIFGQTIIPEFAMITQHGLKTYTNMVVDNYEEHTKSYLLKSQDGQETVRITENTLKELTSNEHQQKAQSFDEKTKAAEKMIEPQYKDFFEPRKNCANNFRHNLSVFCRKEANSPLDALKVANSLISQMSKEEKRKTKDLLNLLRKDGQTVNEVIIDTYHEAVKEVPLNEEYLNNKRYDKMIARPMYDTITDKGQKLDRDFNLKIGDSVKVTFKVDKNAGTKFSLKKENLFQECTIVSSSKEANKVTLMDGNKSFYDVPRDTFLKEYAKREKIEHKQEQKKQRSYSMKLDVER